MSKLSETPSEHRAARDLIRPALLSRNFLWSNAGPCFASRTRRFFPCWTRRPLPGTPPLPAGLAEPRGVFTTLYLRSDLPGNDLTVNVPRNLHRQLRGCVGYAVPIAPLYRAVAETARAAAFEDSRFLPVTKEEALKLEVSLSVLSLLFPIHPEAVEVGRHGLLISHGARRGLLLPQVPVEHGWDRETFLEQTCRKAGLPPGCLAQTATIEAFTAEVFSDSDVRSCPAESCSTVAESTFGPPLSYRCLLSKGDGS